MIILSQAYSAYKQIYSRVSLSLCFVVARPCDDRRRRRTVRGANKARRGQLYARVELEALRRMPLAHVLFHVPLRISPDCLMSYPRALALLALVAITNQATTGCKNCIVLGKEEKAMFRAHSAACAAWSRVAPRQLQALLAGELLDAPALRRHVYCVLLKCKLVSKDGKLHKAAVLGKMAARPDANNATKALESCSEQTGDTPEDLAWNLFRCGYDRKALLFEYMPTNGANEPENNS